MRGGYPDKKELIVIKKVLSKYKEMPIQARASLWFLICTFLQKGISVITTPIFTRLLTTQQYGEFSVFYSWLSLLTVLVTLNLFAGVYTQSLVKFEKERDILSSSLLGLTTVLIIFWTILYLLFQDFFNKLFSLTTVQMLAMLVMMWTSSAFAFWSMYQRVDFHYRKLVALTLAVSVAKPVLGIFFVIHAEDKTTARILAITLVELIAFTGCFLAQMKKGGKFYSRKFWVYALKFNLPLIPHYLSTSVLSSADRIMISNMIGESSAGIYSLAYSLSQLMTMLNSALTQTLEPWMYKKIHAKKVTEIGTIAYPTFVLIVGANLLLIAFAPEIVAIFAPREYHEAIWVIPPVSMSVFFMFLYTFFAVFEFYFERTKYIAAATMGGAVLNIVLNYIFINTFGYLAAGYTTLFCYVLYALLHYLFMKKICKEELNGVQAYRAGVILLIAIVFVALGSLLMLTYKNMLIRYGIILSAVMVVFVKRRMVINLLSDILEAKKSGR